MDEPLYFLVLGAPAFIIGSEFPHNPTVWDSGLFVF
jgi:hypothetical protein